MIEFMSVRLGDADDVKFLTDSVVVTMKNGETTTIFGVTYADVTFTDHQLRITRNSRPYDPPEVTPLRQEVVVTLAVADTYPDGMVDATVMLRPGTVTFSPEVHAGNGDYQVTLNRDVESEDVVTNIW